MLKPLSLLLLATALSQTPSVLAAEVQTFALDYKASFGNFDATATRSLTSSPDNSWVMKSKVEVKLLGSTLASIEETSNFSWQKDLPVSSRYDYVQKGIGKRQRSMVFAASGKSATYTNGDKSGELALTGPVFDNLTGGLVLRKHVQAGESEITVSVADKAESSAQTYQVAGKESIVIPAGTYDTVHIKRIRDTDSKRTTDIWLAPALDYVMVKMVQNEPDGNTITLQLKSGTIGGNAL